jgi:hypothetical protein
VANNRRQQRRQGIRYGPPRERERYSDNGVLIGRFLGLGILLLAVGVLAAGALAFMGDRPGASPTPRRSTSFFAPSIPASPVEATDMPISSPTSVPTPGPTVPVVVPTPIATSIPPLVQIGEGFVTFGTRSDDRLRIIDPRSTFSIDERIVWSAYLTRLADSSDLRVHILKIDSTAVGGERLIVDDAVSPIVRNAQLFQRRIRPESALEGPGVYVVRYMRGTEVMSEGFLEITAE